MSVLDYSSYRSLPLMVGALRLQSRMNGMAIDAPFIPESNPAAGVYLNEFLSSEEIGTSINI